MNSSLRLPVTDPSEAGEARRRVAGWSREQGLTPELAGSVALVVTELATNLANHTVGGELLLRKISTPEQQRGVEVLSLDKGPGVANFSECLRDGFSSTGTAGTGLGAVRRASHIFEVHSQPGTGTGIRSEVWAQPPPTVSGGFSSGAVNVALSREESCGDSWATLPMGAGRMRVIVADGLGHGDLAAIASRKAVEVFQRGGALSLPDLVEAMHQALRSTRGAAVAIAQIDAAAGRVTYTGVGNIASMIVDAGKITRLISHNGTLGMHYRRYPELTYPWSPGAALVMQSDGVKVDWQLDKYAGLPARHPGLMAGVLYRDFRRTNDDATIVVLR
jgi:anti-sigma regulatory factor (Ser/Thr protein kinase)